MIVSSIRAVAFDLDGTLIDSLADLATATNTALARHGYPVHPVDAYCQFVGSGLENLVRRALAPVSDRDIPDLFQHMIRETGEHYKQHWAAQTCPYPEIPALLARLAERQIPVCVVTNKPQEWTEIMLGHFFPETHFAAIQGARPDCPLKPDPEPALRAARVLSLEPAQVAFVGDSNVDMFTAARAGMLGCGAVWGFRGEQELREAGANVLLQHPLELLNVIAR